MAATEVEDALSRVEEFWASVEMVSLVEAVKIRAKRILDLHPLRAADALQLGAALTAAQDEPLGWEFVCLDERLGDAARRERFSVVP
jgi:predicted nucleic acid-binding protein